MSFREALSLPQDCSLRKDFSDGKVFVQMSGLESPDGPAHVSLYDKPWEETPRVPVIHLKAPMGPSANDQIEAALGVEHDDGLSDGDCGCIALDALGVIVRRHRDLTGSSPALES